MLLTNYSWRTAASWLKESLSEHSNPRTSSEDIELEDLSESKEAAQGDPTPELLNEVFDFSDPEPLQLDEMEEAVQRHNGLEQLNEGFMVRDPEQLNEISGFREAAQTNPELEQLNEGLPEREALRIVYRKYTSRLDRELQQLRWSSELMTFSGLSYFHWISWNHRLD